MKKILNRKKTARSKEDRSVDKVLAASLIYEFGHQDPGSGTDAFKLLSDLHGRLWHCHTGSNKQM